ncbi:amino acid adenylation domain-containing protein [Noviherbaspirillum sp.]|jgi:amino acid adenylation domain-containing protein|uniref:non-ribosomal peptide synthetase n=1 Tax=Noviherbaspirillum sp. TaxID=1926288 RepID=UPI0025D19ACF|nr:amino acid adenylation domain-containing protein [Noviherbaspirillum sp.]
MQLKSERIANLSESKRELLERRLRGEFTKVPEPAIPRRADAVPVPLTRRQQGIWIAERLYGNAAIWNLADGFRLSGRLDVGLFQQALKVSFDRHEVFRSKVSDGHEAFFELVEGVELPFQQIDLSDLPPEQAEQAAMVMANKIAAEAFNIHAASLLRIRLIRIGYDDHLLVFVLHHIIGDGWSLGVIVKEVQEAYSALVAQRPHRLAPLPIRFSDYAVWSKETTSRASSEANVMLEKQLARLANAPALVTFPTDYPRPAVFDVEGGCHRFSIPKPIVERVASLSRELRVSQFTTMLAAFKVLLARMSGQYDVVIGSSVANRLHVEVEPLVGMFVNTLVYRTDLSDAPSFVEAVKRVNEVGAQVLAGQAIPFEDVLAKLELSRELSFHPVFQVMFIYQNWPFPALDFPGLQIRRVGVHSSTAKHDMHFVFEERDATLEGCIEFSKTLYRPETIERLAGHFVTLLEGIAADPACRITELPLLRPGQRQQLLTAWNDTAHSYPHERCVHEIIGEQALRTPHAIAVEHNDKCLTYAELERKSNQLAHYLRALGVTTGTVVGLCVERSLDMVVGLLGILKAGGAYLPLDPGYPAERLAYMLDDARVGVIVAQSLVEPVLPKRTATMVRLDDDRKVLSRQPVDAPQFLADASNLAYVIYTSGSTGRPKGVMIQHRALINFLYAMRREPGLVESDVLAAATPLSFDIAGLEIYLPLVVGAKLVVVPRLLARDGAGFRELLAQERITALQATPSTWRLLLEAGWRPDGKMKMLCGGEAMPPDVAATLLAGGGEVWNLYGPTETTIWSTVCRLNAGDDVSIGRPIANTRVYVLDESRQPVPVGVAGELHIGGDGLAKGYWDRPELTAERFIIAPFGRGERLYRTGDLVRWRVDGRLEYLGRMDQQIKLRGYRIELGEIESVAREYDGVVQAIVVAHEVGRGDTQLVAYLVSDAADVDTAALRGFLRQRLPEYMVPAVFVRLDALPLTPNGKVDRRALPKPAALTPRAPLLLGSLSNIEKALVRIWSEVLQRSDFGIDDNFFELGGHSLLVLRVQASLADILGSTPAVTVLFQYPTIRTLAGHLSGADDGEGQSQAGQARGLARKELAGIRRRARPGVAGMSAEGRQHG